MIPLCDGGDRRRSPAAPRRGRRRSPASPSTRGGAAGRPVRRARRHPGRRRRRSPTRRCAAGAAAALRRRTATPARAGSRVDDPLVALGRIAAAGARGARPRAWSASPARRARRRPRTCCARCSAPHAAVVASRENQNNELGVPLTLCRDRPGHRGGRREMAMRGLGQIADLAEIARPDVAVITYVGPVHLELLGTRRAGRRGQGRDPAPRCRRAASRCVPARRAAARPAPAAIDRRVVTFRRGGGRRRAPRRASAPRAGRRGGRARRRRSNVAVLNFDLRATTPCNLAAAAAVYAGARPAARRAGARAPARCSFSRWRGEEIDRCPAAAC